MTDPIQIFNGWFDAQGKHVRGQVLLYSGGIVRERAERSPPKTPLEALQECAEISEELAKSEGTFRAWLTADQEWNRQLCRVLFVRSVVSFLIFRFGHTEGREAARSSWLKTEKELEKLAGCALPTELKSTPEEFRQQDIEWIAASQSWSQLCNTSLSDEALEGWLMHAMFR